MIGGYPEGLQQTRQVHRYAGQAVGRGGWNYWAGREALGASGASCHGLHRLRGVVVISNSIAFTGWFSVKRGVVYS